MAVMILFSALSLPIYKLTVKQFSATATCTDGLKVWGVKTRVANDPNNCGACSVSFSQCKRDNSEGVRLLRQQLLINCNHFCCHYC